MSSDRQTQVLHQEKHDEFYAPDYDVVIMGGRVTDPETSFDAVRNVGIKERKIVTITEKGMGCSRSLIPIQ